jgi:hypothetical protein
VMWCAYRRAPWFRCAGVYAVRPSKEGWYQ